MEVSHEAEEGLLRRRRVKAVTASIYSSAVVPFYSAYQLGPLATKCLVDRALDSEMVRLYLLGELPQKCRVLFYGILWDRTWQVADLPLSNASRIGYNRSCRVNVEKPISFESVLLQVVALLTMAVRVCAKMPRRNNPLLVTARELAEASVCMLLSFDLYARGGELLDTVRSEVFPPIRNQSGTAACWSVTTFQRGAQEPQNAIEWMSRKQ